MCSVSQQIVEFHAYWTIYKYFTNKWSINKIICFNWTFVYECINLWIILIVNCCATKPLELDLILDRNNRPIQHMFYLWTVFFSIFLLAKNVKINNWQIFSTMITTSGRDHTNVKKVGFHEPSINHSSVAILWEWHSIP